MKIDTTTLLTLLTLVLIAFTQYLILDEGGWNPGLIGSAGLVLIMLVRNLRGTP